MMSKEKEERVQQCVIQVLELLETHQDDLTGEEMLLVLNIAQAGMLSTVVDVNEHKTKMKHVLTLSDLEVIGGPEGMFAWVTKVDKIFRLDAEDGWKEVNTYDELTMHTYEEDPEVEGQ